MKLHTSRLLQTDMSTHEINSGFMNNHLDNALTKQNE